MVLWQPVQGDLEPGQPGTVTFPASSEAIDALLGAKRSSPRVVPDETKLAITDCASRGFAMSKTFGAAGHLWSPLGFIAADHPFSLSHAMNARAFPMHAALADRGKRLNYT